MKVSPFAAIVFGLWVALAVPAQHGKPDAVERSPFRYVIVADVTDLQKYINRGDSTRDLVVLIEENAFNEKNLTELFILLGKRFNDRPALFVHVTTSMEAIRTPEEYDQLSLGGGLDDNQYEFKHAFYSRNGYGEQYWYRYPRELITSHIRVMIGKL